MASLLATKGLEEQQKKMAANIEALQKVNFDHALAQANKNWSDIVAPAWESPNIFVDNRGNIRVKKPIKMVTFTYYQYEYGMRYCSAEIEGRLRWDTNKHDSGFVVTRTK